MPAIEPVITPVVDGFALLRSHANPIRIMAEVSEATYETKNVLPQVTLK